jgi:hypothetical protein
VSAGGTIELEVDTTRSMQRHRRVAHGGPLFRVVAEDAMAALSILKCAQAGEGLDHQIRVPGGTGTWNDLPV